MISKTGTIAFRYALPASILLILTLVLRLIFGYYYQEKDWLLIVNLGIDLSIITLFSYRCMKNAISESEVAPSQSYLFLLFNWTSVLTSLIFMFIANIFFYIIDPKAWQNIERSLIDMVGMQFSAAQFILLLFIFYVNFSVIWSAFYLGMRKRFT
jgi:hypothetical protein